METQSFVGLPDSLLSRAEELFPAPPRCHIFRTRAKTYAFDTDTAQIVTCDAVSEALLAALGRPGFRQAVADLCPLHGPDVVAKALNTIITLSTTHAPPLFSTKDPEDIVFTADYEHFRREAASNVFHITISLTGKCTCECRYCSYTHSFYRDRDRNQGIMTEEILLKSIDYYLDHSTRRSDKLVSFFGGEPTLMMPLVRRAVDHVRNRCGEAASTFSIGTNLVNVADEDLRYFVDNNMLLAVSLDGPAAVHDRYRVQADGSPTFDRIMANLAKLRNLSEDYFNNRISFISTWAPPYDLVSVYDFFGTDPRLPQSVRLVGNLASLPDTAFWEGVDTDEGAESYNKLMAEFAQRVKAGVYTADSPYGTTARDCVLHHIFVRRLLYVYRRRLLKSSPPDVLRYGGACLPGVKKIFVNYDGSFYPCERLMEHPDFRIGDYLNGVDVDKAYRLTQFLMASIKEDCKKCWALRLCNSICYNHLWDCSGVNHRKRREECESHKTARSLTLSLMASILEENPRGCEFLNALNIMG